MSAHILLVEDSSTDRALIRATLRQENPDFRFADAGSPEEAIEALRGGGFDLVIVDHLLQGGTGLEVLEALRDEGLTIPAIYLTSETSRAVVERALALGASHYLAKDASYPQLLGPVVSRSLEIARADLLGRARADFLQKVTHELRTPMSSILGYTDCLIDGLDGPLSARQVTSLERVRKNGRRLLAYINDLLDFSALEARRVDPAPGTFALAGLLEELVSPLRSGVPETVQLVVACAPGLTVRCDRDLLGRAVGHLLANAVRYTAQGHVRLEAHADPVARGLVHVAVVDTGPGIAPRLISTVREPFRQGSEGLGRSHEGLGLGLALAERLARLLEGELEVESAEGAGSTFRLALPILDPGGPAAPASGPCRVRSAGDDHPPPVLTGAENPHAAGSPGPATLVLAIDRDAETHALAQKILSPAGIRVHGVLSIAFALAQLAESQPHAILLDLSTAKLDADLVGELREEASRRGIPTLSMRLSGERHAEAAALDKPFHPDELVARVRAAISGAPQPREGG